MRISSWSRLIGMLGLTALPAFAGIPEPDVILFGNVCINGQRVLATTDTTVLACVNCAGGYVAPGIASYHMGATDSAGNLYVLRLRLESLADGSAPAANAARVGDLAHIYLRQGNGVPTLIRSYNIADRGVLERADLTIGTTCTVLNVVSSIPPTGTVDARQPSDLNGANPAGFNSVRFVFNGPGATLNANDFEVTSTAGSTPTITTVAPTGNSVNLTFNGPIPAGAWTNVRYHPTGADVRIGFLPGDVNGSGTSTPADILDLVNALNGVATRPITSTDVDRSGAANASDVQRLIDLLNGTNAYEIWNGRSVPP